MIRAQIWDTVGDERFKSVSNIYLEGAVGSFICYDGTNPQLFSNLKDWLDQLRNVANEDTEFNQYDLNPYVLSKYLSQQEALGFAEHGLDLVVVNPAFPFGPGDTGPTPTGQLIVNLLKGLQFHIKGGFNGVDVRDVAEGHVLAAEKGICGEKYILANEDVTFKEFTEMVEEASPKKVRSLPLPLPGSLMQGTAFAMKWFSDNVSHTAPMSTPAEVKYISKYVYVDNNKAQRELGFSPRDLSISIRDAIDWFREHGYIK